MFANHVHCSLTAHDRLLVVPDTVEEEEDDEVDGDLGRAGRLQGELISDNHQSVDRKAVYTEAGIPEDSTKSTNLRKATLNGIDKISAGNFRHQENVNQSQNKSITNENSCNNIVTNYKDTETLNPPPSLDDIHFKEEETSTIRKESPHDAVTEMESSAALSHLPTDIIPPYATNTPREMTSSRKTSTASGASSSGSLDESTESSSVPDFRILKSAMKRSCEESRTGKRKLSLFNTVMRRVSIHRRESTPTGRIATFLFGADEAADDTKEHDDDNVSEKQSLKGS